MNHLQLTNLYLEQRKKKRKLKIVLLFNLMQRRKRESNAFRTLNFLVFFFLNTKKMFELKNEEIWVQRSLRQHLPPKKGKMKSPLSPPLH